MTRRQGGQGDWWFFFFFFLGRLRGWVCPFFCSCAFFPPSLVLSPLTLVPPQIAGDCVQQDVSNPRP